MIGAASRSIVFCDAAEDAALAREIGDFLETHLPVTAFYEEGLIRPEFDLVDAAARGLSADTAIVLLSPHTIPKRWDRARWEPVLLQEPREFGSQIIFVVASECRVPDLLRRQAFFDKREIKRHLLRQSEPFQNTVDLPEPIFDFQPHLVEGLRVAIADRPGSAEGVSRDLALEFATACRGDFEAICWIDCAGRSRTGISGDVSHALGLRLSGSFGQNRRALLAFSELRRCLFIFEHLSRDDLDLVASTAAATASDASEDYTAWVYL